MRNVVKDLEELCEECGKGFRKKGLFGSPHTTFRVVWGVWGCWVWVVLIGEGIFSCDGTFLRFHFFGSDWSLDWQVRC